jgi:hypothetical protein
VRLTEEDGFGLAHELPPAKHLNMYTVDSGKKNYTVDLFKHQVLGQLYKLIKPQDD